MNIYRLVGGLFATFMMVFGAVVSFNINYRVAFVLSLISAFIFFILFVNEI